MTLGAFGVLIALGRGEKPNDDLDHLRGLADRRPLLAGAMTIFLLSLTGIPPLAGFVSSLIARPPRSTADRLARAVLAERRRRGAERGDRKDQGEERGVEAHGGWGTDAGVHRRRAGHKPNLRPPPYSIT